MPQNHPSEFVVIPSGYAGALIGAALMGVQVLNTRADLVTITVRHLPEGVWLASSDDLPGLVVETETRDEAIDLARHLAIDLLEFSGKHPDRAHQKFAFIFPTT